MSVFAVATSKIISYCDIETGKIFTHKYLRPSISHFLPYDHNNGLFILATYSDEKPLVVRDCYSDRCRSPKRVFNEKKKPKYLGWLFRGESPSLFATVGPYKSYDIKIWNVEEEDCKYVFEKPHKYSIKCISGIKEKNQMISSSDFDRCVKLWDIGKVKFIKTLEKLRGKVECVDDSLVYSTDAWSTFLSYDLSSDRIVRRWKIGGSIADFYCSPELHQTVVLAEDECFVFDDRNEKEPIWKSDKIEKSKGIVKYNARKFITRSNDDFFRIWDIENKTTTRTFKFERVQSMYVLKLTNVNEKFPKSYESTTAMRKMKEFETVLDRFKDHLVYQPVRDEDFDFFETGTSWNLKDIEYFDDLKEKYKEIVRENRKRLYNQENVTIYIGNGFKVYKTYEGGNKGLKPHGKGTFFWAFGKDKETGEEIPYTSFEGEFVEGNEQFGTSYQSTTARVITSHCKINPNLFKNEKEFLKKIIKVEVVLDESQRRFFCFSSCTMGKGIFFEYKSRYHDNMWTYYLEEMTERDDDYEVVRELKCPISEGYPKISASLIDCLEKSNLNFDYMKDLIHKKLLEENGTNRKEVLNIGREITKVQGDKTESDEQFKKEIEKLKFSNEKLTKDSKELRANIDDTKWTIKVREATVLRLYLLIGLLILIIGFLIVMVLR